MAVEVKLPALGESITEATVARWLHKDGEVVRAGQPICEVETEKATQELTAPKSGRLRIAVQEGERVAIGAVLGRIEEAPVPEPAADGGVKKTAPAAVTAAPVPSPSARRLATEEGVDVAQVKGTGREGRVTKEDVVKHVDQRSAPIPPPAPARVAEKTAGTDRTETRQRMTAVRQRIAERLIQVQHSAAILTTFNEADMTAVMALRAKYKEPFQKKHGVGLGFMSFFVRAAVEALRAFPLVNSRIEGSDIVTPSYQDIGVAVSTEKGLMVPVLRDAGRMSFAGVEKAIADLAEKSRTGKIGPDDLRGGTFTITNGGVFGSLLSTPLLNPPQTAILGMHTIQKRPVVLDDQIVIRQMMYLALSYDHRLIDGKEAVSFLVRIKECIESPERLLLEV